LLLLHQRTRRARQSAGKECANNCREQVQQCAFTEGPHSIGRRTTVRCEGSSEIFVSSCLATVRPSSTANPKLPRRRVRRTQRFRPHLWVSPSFEWPVTRIMKKSR